MIEMPNEPLPDPEDLRLDFDRCVLEHYEECSYEQDSHPATGGGHNSQVAQFCGHYDVSNY